MSQSNSSNSFAYFDGQLLFMSQLFARSVALTGKSLEAFRLYTLRTEILEGSQLVIMCLLARMPFLATRVTSSIFSNFLQPSKFYMDVFSKLKHMKYLNDYCIDVRKSYKNVFNPLTSSMGAIFGLSTGSPNQIY